MKALILFVWGIVMLAGAALLLAAITSFVTYLAWNAVMPDLLGLKQITWWQAFALNVLCGMLFNQATSSSKS